MWKRRINKRERIIKEPYLKESIEWNIKIRIDCLIETIRIGILLK